MRIVIYTFEFLPFSGGIATYCHELARGLSTIGHEVTVVAPQVGKIEIRRIPYSVVWIPKSRGRVSLMISGIRTLRSVVQRGVPNAILVTNQYALISVAVFGAFVRKMCVPILHGSEILKHSNAQTIVRRMLSWRMGVFYAGRHLTICVSDFTKRLFLRKFHVPENRVFVVYNGMKDEFGTDTSSASHVRRQWNATEETTVLLTLARLVPRKGQDTVIRALPRIVTQRPDVLYVCAGDGPYGDELRKLAVELGVQDYVVFSGHVPEEEKHSYYAACDLFVMVSRQHAETVEGFGLSFLEAWHASKPVLGGCHGGVVEVIEEGVDGVLVDPLSVEAVAEAILSLVSDRAKMKEMGARGNMKAVATYSDTAMASLVAQSLRVVRQTS